MQRVKPSFPSLHDWAGGREETVVSQAPKAGGYHYRILSMLEGFAWPQSVQHGAPVERPVTRLDLPLWRPQYNLIGSQQEFGAVPMLTVFDYFPSIFMILSFALNISSHKKPSRPHFPR